MKRCSYCKEVLPLTEFYNDRHRADGLCHRCKLCTKDWNSLYFRRYYKKHQSKIQDKMREYMREKRSIPKG